jgi:hypothetical protein
MKRFNLGCLIKILAVVALIVIGVFAYTTCSANTGCGCQKIDKSLPPVSAAPYTVTIKTGTLYAEKAITNENKSVTVYGWYEKINGKWVRHPGPDTLPPVLKPVIGAKRTSTP